MNRGSTRLAQTSWTRLSERAMRESRRPGSPGSWSRSPLDGTNSTTTYRRQGNLYCHSDKPIQAGCEARTSGSAAEQRKRGGATPDFAPMAAEVEAQLAFAEAELQPKLRAGGVHAIAMRDHRRRCASELAGATGAAFMRFG
jgi:hypothetical protein